MDEDSNSRSPVLYVEDEPNDVFLMRHAFQSADIDHPVVALRDGQEAIDYLRGHGKHENRANFPLPCLMITDIKMPRVNGFDLLRWLQSQPELSSLPVIALSSSCHEKDLQKALGLGARAYRVKPSGLEGLLRFAKEVKDLWLPAYCAS
jgi:CheY-like chemotaxis protein